MKLFYLLTAAILFSAPTFATEADFDSTNRNCLFGQYSTDAFSRSSTNPSVPAELAARGLKVEMRQTLKTSGELDELTIASARRYVRSRFPKTPTTKELDAAFAEFSNGDGFVQFVRPVGAAVPAFVFVAFYPGDNQYGAIYAITVEGEKYRFALVAVIQDQEITSCRIR